MRRRTFLGAAALGSTGACATANPGSRPPLPREDIEAALDRHDHVLARLETHDDRAFLARLAGPDVDWAQEPELASYVRQSSPVVKRSVRTLISAGELAELSRPDVESPRVRAVLDREAPMMGFSVAEQLMRVQDLTPRERRRYAAAFAEDPQLTMRVAQELDTEAAELGVSRRTRAKLRGVASRVSVGLHRQRGLDYVDEVSLKMNRLMAHRGIDMERVRRAIEDGPSALALSCQARGDVDDRSTGANRMERWTREEEFEKWTRVQKSSRGAAIAGGVLVGVAFLSLGIGAAFGPWGLVVGGGTIGGILLITGLVMLIIGAARGAKARRKLESLGPSYE